MFCKSKFHNQFPAWGKFYQMEISHVIMYGSQEIT